jgi:hypothetical protein
VCARIFYLLLAAMFVYVTVTVAAFVYLDWWQAILVSAGTFAALVLAGRFLVKMTFGRMVDRAGDLARGLMETKSRVLRGASVDVHTIRPAAVPAGVIEWAETVREEGNAEERAEARAAVEDPAWYRFEVTIFPDPNQPTGMTHWDVDDLRLVPVDAKPIDQTEDEEEGPEFELHDVRVIEHGQEVQPGDGKLHGPRRLRFVAGLPKDVRQVKFQYYFEQFGPFAVAPTGLPGLPPAAGDQP